MLQVWIWCLLWLNCHTTTALPNMNLGKLAKTKKAAPSTAPATITDPLTEEKVIAAASSTAPATITDPLTEEKVIACPRNSFCIPPQYCNEGDVVFKWRPKSSLGFVCGTLSSDGNICCSTTKSVPNSFVPNTNLWFYSESQSNVNEESVVNVLPWKDYDLSENDSTQELEQSDSDMLVRTNISNSGPGSNFNQQINIHIDLSPSLLLSSFKDGGVSYDYNLEALEADTHLLDGKSRKRRDVSNAPSECQFPFIYKDDSYSECTTKDDPNGQLWCSTSTSDQNHHIKGNWKHCRSFSNVAVNNANVLDEETTGRSFGSDLVEDDGKLCGVSVNRLLAGRSRFDDIDVQEHKNLAKEGEYPWQVAILSRDVEYRCGGVVVGKRHVITVAHCVVDVTADDILVRVGDFDLSSDEERHPSYDIAVRWIKIHPSFIEAKLRDDLALLEVKFNLYRLVNVAPACLPTPESYSDVSNCKVPGWGQFETSVADMGPHKFTYTMMVAGFRTLPRGECQTNLRATRKVGAFFKLQKGNICAIGNDGGDACHGDGGSGLICPNDQKQYIVEGLVSWGLGCGLGHPGAYVDIRYYLDWIIKEIDSPVPLPVQSTSKPVPEPAPQNTLPYQPPVAQTTQISSAPSVLTLPESIVSSSLPQSTLSSLPPQPNSEIINFNPRPTNLNSHTKGKPTLLNYFTPSAVRKSIVATLVETHIPERPVVPSVTTVATFDQTEVSPRTGVVAPTTVTSEETIYTYVPPSISAPSPTNVATLEVTNLPQRPATGSLHLPPSPATGSLSLPPSPANGSLHISPSPGTGSLHIPPVSDANFVSHGFPLPPGPGTESGHQGSRFDHSLHPGTNTQYVPPGQLLTNTNYGPPPPGPLPGPNTNYGPPPGPITDYGPPPGPLPGPITNYGPPPGPLPGPNTNYGPPPGPNTDYGPPGPIPSPNTNYGPPPPPPGPLPGPNTNYGPPPGPITDYGHPPGPLPGPNTNYGPPPHPGPLPSPNTNYGPPPGPITDYGPPPGPITDYGPPPGPITEYGPPPGPLPGPNTNYGPPPPGPITDYGPPPGPITNYGPLPGPNTNYGPPPGPNTDYGPPGPIPSPNTNYGPPPPGPLPGPNTNYGPPPGPITDYGPPPGPLPGPNTNYGPPPGPITNYGPPSGPNTNYGPPPGPLPGPPHGHLTGPNTDYGPPPGPNTDYGPPGPLPVSPNTNYGLPPPGPNTKYGIPVQ